MYRTYDGQWNRTGYATVPQYSGQAGVTDDYPAKCHCGSTMAGWNAESGASCASGHKMHREPC